MFYWIPNIFKGILAIVVAIVGYLTYCKFMKKKKQPIRVEEKEEDYGTPVAPI